MGSPVVFSYLDLIYIYIIKEIYEPACYAWELNTEPIYPSDIPVRPGISCISGVRRARTAGGPVDVCAGDLPG